MAVVVDPPELLGSRLYARQIVPRRGCCPTVLYFSARAKFLGDQSLAFGNTLSFDAKDIGIGTSNLDDPELILVGDGKTLYYLAGFDPSTAWTHFEITLAPDSDWHLNGFDGLMPTEANFASVLGSLDSMYLLGDWISGEDDSGLDNVEMIVPEPSTILLLGLGLKRIAQVITILKAAP